MNTSTAQKRDLSERFPEKWASKTSRFNTSRENRITRRSTVHWTLSKTGTGQKRFRLPSITARSHSAVKASDLFLFFRSRRKKDLSDCTSIHPALISRRLWRRVL